MEQQYPVRDAFGGASDGYLENRTLIEGTLSLIGIASINLMGGNGRKAKPLIPSRRPGCNEVKSRDLVTKMSSSPGGRQNRNNIPDQVRDDDVQKLEWQLSQ